MSRRLLNWTALATVCWIAEGLISGLSTRQMVAAAGSTDFWTYAYVPSMASALLWVPFTVGAFALARRHPIGRPVPGRAGAWWTSIGLHLAGLAVVILGRALAVVLLNDRVHWYNELPPVDELLLTSVLNNLFMYGLIVAVAHGLHHAHQNRLRESQLVRAELSALRAQVRPHFLFNVLNSIAALIPTRPQDAEDMTVRLAELLRGSLAADDVEVPLRDELALVESYLDIERVRFADRLSTRWEIDPKAAEALVPPLILQPLVENAIRHGIAPCATGGTLVVGARVHDSTVELTVRDDGTGPPSTELREGVGIGNTRARLAQLHPHRHGFTLTGAPGRGTLVTVTIPYRRSR